MPAVVKLCDVSWKGLEGVNTSDKLGYDHFNAWRRAVKQSSRWKGKPFHHSIEIFLHNAPWLTTFQLQTRTNSGTYSQQSLFTSCWLYITRLYTRYDINPSWQGWPKCMHAWDWPAIHWQNLGGGFELGATLSILYGIFNLQTAKDEAPQMEHSKCWVILKTVLAWYFSPLSKQECLIHLKHNVSATNSLFQKLMFPCVFLQELKAISSEF